MKTSTNLAACIERGREPRVTLNWHAVAVEADGASTEVILVDVSQHGFRLQSQSEFEVDTEVLLQIPQIPAVRGMIRWICGQEVGGVFLDPIAL